MAEGGGFGSRFRRLPRGLRLAHNAMLLSLALLGAVWSLEIHADLGIVIFKEQFLALVFSIALAGLFIAVPAGGGDPGRGVPWYDWILAILSIVAGGYVLVRFPVLRDDLGLLSADRWGLGTVAVLLVMEATRRVSGWTLIVLAAVLTLYARFANHFPGILEAPAEPWDRLAVYMYLDNNALFGFPLTVTVSMIIAFILFGRMLYAVNGDRILTDFALAAMGAFRGGPAKVAIIASSFFGTISGSAVANVLMDGPITIPMMRKAGFPGHVAAATEAVASTGGQIMPPVMGITAFIMAEFLAVPYGDVVLAALLPALLYYVALFAQIDLESAKLRLAGLPRDQLPKLAAALRRGSVFAIPIFVLIWTLMVELWQPGKSAMAAAGVTLLVGMLQRETRPTLIRVAQELRETGRIILDLVVITAIAGVIIGLLQLTGLAFNISLLLTTMAQGNLPVLLALTALLCILLGMGMPSAVIYIVLSVIAAPALVEAGVVKMSAHLFLFYFGMLSMITPPVCLATIAAISVAGTGFWKTGLAGVRLGFIAYIVPFLIVYQPELIFEGSAAAIVVVFVKAVAGVIVLCGAVAGYLSTPIGIAERLITAAAGFAILGAPYDSGFGLAMVSAGLGAVALLYWRGRRTAQTPA